MGPYKWVSIRPDFRGLKWVPKTPLFCKLKFEKGVYKISYLIQGPNSLSIRPHFNFPLN